MEKVFHPVTGQNGYFCSETEKELIDAVFESISLTSRSNERDMDE